MGEIATGWQTPRRETLSLRYKPHPHDVWLRRPSKPQYRLSSLTPADLTAFLNSVCSNSMESTDLFLIGLWSLWLVVVDLMASLGGIRVLGYYGLHFITEASIGGYAGINYTNILTPSQGSWIRLPESQAWGFDFIVESQLG